MVIAEIIEKLKTSTHPVARIFHKGHDSRVLIIGFNKGMTLSEHKAHLPSKLLVISGSVNYIQGKSITKLGQYQETEIPIDIIHEVYANEDSICILTQAK